MNIGLSIHNHFEFKLKRDGKVIQTAKAENVVLNQLFDCYNGATNQHITSGGQWVMLCLGTGTTSPAVTDTSLVAQVYQARVDTYNYSLDASGVNTMVVSKTVPEASAIGLLAEVGLTSEAQTPTTSTNKLLVTRALITDSEGNPITINKTVSDILEVTATVYFQINLTSTYDLVRGQALGTGILTLDTNLVGTDVPVDVCSQNAIPGLMPDLGLELFMRFGSLGQGTGGSNGYYTGYGYTFWGISKPATSNMPSVGGGTHGYIFALSSDNQYTNNDLMRATSASVASTAQNRTVTYLIKSIMTPGSFLITFPNSTIYPPKQLNLPLTGDGTTTDFDFPVPELATRDVSVSINGMVQDPSTYTFTGKNFSMQQAWCSFDNKYLIQSGYVFIKDRESGEAARSGGFYNLEYPCAWTKSTVLGSLPPASLNARTYDFQSPKTVNTFKNTVINNNIAAAWRVALEYSTDGTTWTQAAEVPARTADTVTFSPITARYWRITNIPTTLGNSSVSITDADIPFGFDDVQPGIRFATPPALGDSIEVTCYCDYPMKNSNWRIDGIVTDIKYTRSVNP